MCFILLQLIWNIIYLLKIFYSENILYIYTLINISLYDVYIIYMLANITKIPGGERYI